MSENRKSWDRVLDTLGPEGLGTSDVLSVSDLIAIGDQMGVHMIGIPLPPEEEQLAMRARRLAEIERRKEEERKRVVAYFAEKERMRPTQSAIRSRELRRKQKSKR